MVTKIGHMLFKINLPLKFLKLKTHIYKIRNSIYTFTKSGELLNNNIYLILTQEKFMILMFSKMKYLYVEHI